MIVPPSVCYLCGKALVEPTSADHVPPKQFYADDSRNAHNPNLLTITVHGACNRAGHEKVHLTRKHCLMLVNLMLHAIGSEKSVSIRTYPGDR